MRTILRLILLIIALTFIHAVDRSKFRKCSDTGFCRRHRDKSASNIQYTLNVNTVRVDERGRLSGVVRTSQSDTEELQLLVSGCETGAIRLQLIEKKERWAPTGLLTTKATTSSPFTRLTAGDSKLPEVLRALTNDDIVAMAFHNPSSGDDSILAIYPKSLVMELYQGGELVIRANARNLMHFELSGQASQHRMLSNRSKEDADLDRHEGKEVVDYGEDGLALYKDGSKEVRVTHSDPVSEPSIHGDNFGGHKDSQINGPVSVGMDFSFPFSQNVYGIPEHSSPLSLPSTTRGSSGAVPHYTEPYRLYNLDVFEYELDQTMSLYGNIPLLLAHGIKGGKGQTAGIFWFNPSETFIDISDEVLNTGSEVQYKASHWISESGNIDVFLLPGPSPNSVYSQFTSLTGTQQLPPMFSLGYHQCRWNYRDERDIAQVESTFEQLDYPVDVLWLDIEHTDGKRYFTWDKSLFPNPIEMQRNVSRHGRKMVTIVDPHIKRDSHWNTHSEATSLGYYIKDSHGGDFDGWCWPGSSSYLDFTAEKVRKWWAERFSLDKYIGSTMDLFTWNDMNEPSVFNGPEVSMPKDAKNLDGIEHREWHNLYGIYMQMATALGLQSRAVPPGADQQRPFVLTRAFWAGSQRYGAMWTGDNTADWGHLKISVPMLLSINLAGLSFAGADVGGFFGEPSAELFTRWYQAGSFTPFFRGHAHLDTKRREPWVFGDPYTAILRKAAMLRYTLLPYWYTTFFHAYDRGLPVMRTMWSEFPNDVHALTLQNQWLVGAALLVVPVTDPGKTSVPAYLPPGSKWYHLDTLKEEAACTGIGEDGGRVNLAAPLEHIPVLIRGGNIVPRKMRLRRSSKLMFYDPYTLVVAPNAEGEAFGTLYLDDEITLAHETRKIYALRRFTFRNNVLTCDGTGVYEATNTVERIVIAGIALIPKRVILRETSLTDTAAIDLVFFYDESHRVLTVKKPDVRVDKPWAIILEM